MTRKAGLIPIERVPARFIDAVLGHANLVYCQYVDGRAWLRFVNGYTCCVLFVVG